MDSVRHIKAMLAGKNDKNVESRLIVYEMMFMT